MGIIERRKREKEERRQVIIVATKQLILDKGVAGFSMRDVAEMAELSKATLYIYFQNKETILTEILQDAGDQFLTAVKNRSADVDSGLGRLRAMWAAYLSLFGESADVFVLAGIKAYIDPAFPFGERKDDSPVQAIWQGMGELIADAIRAGIADGTMYAKLDADKSARTVLMATAAIIDKIAWVPRKDRDGRLILETIRDFFELLLQGLADSGIARESISLPV